MWEHNEDNQAITIEHVRADSCVFCRLDMLRLPAHEFVAGEQRLFFQISICPQCGWWTVYKVHQGERRERPEFQQFESYSGSAGCLKNLDLTDISVPLNEVRQYFLAKRNSMLEAHPKIMEDVVCSIFRDQGYESRVTAYSGDDGIDVILDNPSGGTIGVQVKRYGKDKRIEAEQIRSLTGAMVLGRHTKGIFVTTTKFRRGAIKTAQKFTSIGYPVELIDADGFLERLGLAQQRTFELTNEQARSYVMRRSIHLGTGIAKPFSPDEDLRDRPVIASIQLVSDMLEAASRHETDEETEAGDDSSK